MSRALILLLYLFASLLPLNAQSDPDELLQRGIARVRDTADRLPRYLCTQTMDRVEWWVAHIPYLGCDWWPPDDRFRSSQWGRVRVDVLSAAGGELYSWAGENRFRNQDLVQLVRIGPLSTGGFSGFLQSIFGDNHVFSYLGEVTGSGRKLRQYGFRVPRERSEYWIGTGSERRIVASEGTFLLDAETADLVRLVVKSADPPQVTGACQATTTLDYGRTRLNESEFLLPTSTVFEFVGTKGQEARNRSVYSGCHEFRGESALRFDPPEPGPRPSDKAPGQPESELALPEGLPFRIVLTQDIAYRAAAGGDTIAAKLATPIQDAAKHVLVPAGTPVAARILDEDFWRRRQGAGTVMGAHLVFRLESLTIAGIAHPFVATSAQRVETSDPLAYDAVSRVNTEYGPGLDDPNWRDLLLAPNTAVLEFYDVRPNFVLKAGTQSKWRTGGTGPTVDCLSGAKSCK